MNSPIKECQATANAYANGLKPIGLYAWQQAYEKKFAELIVIECAEVIRKEVSMKYIDGGETEEFMGGHYAGSLLARTKIKRHFGLKHEHQN